MFFDNQIDQIALTLTQVIEVRSVAGDDRPFRARDVGIKPAARRRRLSVVAAISSASTRSAEASLLILH